MRFDAVIFDLDGTLVHYPEDKYGSSWGAIMYAAGVKEKYDPILPNYLDKPELYPECFQKEVILLKGKSVSKIIEKVLPPPYTGGAKYASKKLKEMGLLRGIITTGLDLVANYVKDDLDLDFCYCNKLVIENGSFTGEGELLVDLWKKDIVFNQFCEEFGLKPKKTVVVGDDFNDLPMIKMAGLPIAFNPKSEEIKNSSHYVIHNLKELPLIIRKL
jgi:phosphoserine phosphatase